MNKKLLVVCDLGHCSHRIPDLANQLSILGWEVTILTPKMSKRQRLFIGINDSNSFQEIQTRNFTMILDRFSHFGNRIQYWYRVFEYKKMRLLRFRYISKLHITGFPSFPEELVEENTPWINESLKLCHSDSSLNRFDLVLSSSSPISSHVIGREIGFKMNIPWCADFRDLWANNHVRSSIERNKLTTIETALLKNLTGAITVSDGFASKLRETYSGPIKVIHNSYNQLARFRDIDKSKLPLSILYTGSIYETNQNYNLVLQALEKINQDAITVTIKFVGPNVNIILSHFESLNQKLPKYVQIRNSVPRAQAHKLQREADFGLLLNWEDSNVEGVETTKLFEYISAGLPILATGGTGNDAVFDIISKTGSGVYLQTVDSIYDFLRLAIKRRSHGLKRIDEISLNYSFLNQSLELDDYLKELLSSFANQK